MISAIPEDLMNNLLFSPSMTSLSIIDLVHRFADCYYLNIIMRPFYL
jgi:hypothetical protein